MYTFMFVCQLSLKSINTRRTHWVKLNQEKYLAIVAMLALLVILQSKFKLCVTKLTGKNGYFRLLHFQNFLSKIVKHKKNLNKLNEMQVESFNISLNMKLAAVSICICSTMT